MPDPKVPVPAGGLRNKKVDVLAWLIVNLPVTGQGQLTDFVLAVRVLLRRRKRRDFRRVGAGESLLDDAIEVLAKRRVAVFRERDQRPLLGRHRKSRKRLMSGNLQLRRQAITLGQGLLLSAPGLFTPPSLLFRRKLLSGSPRMSYPAEQARTRTVEDLWLDT